MSKLGSLAGRLNARSFRACVRRCPACGISAFVKLFDDQTGVRSYLRKKIVHVDTSEYMDGVEPGSFRDGVRCEDVQRLSFADGQFDLCTSTEVFEHVRDDIAGFRESHRALKKVAAAYSRFR
ncbi:MAG TPA: methyltransferase domain-containing protein [Xanthomonadaceae bacterium]|jgi:hypothetical protein|nr:methyltransferase domain-containing protein [Xanthomonadaceae bacterium]